MKKTLVVLIACIFAFGAVACENNSTKETTAETTAETTVETTAETTVEESEVEETNEAKSDVAYISPSDQYTDETSNVVEPGSKIEADKVPISDDNSSGETTENELIENMGEKVDLPVKPEIPRKAES